MYRYVFIYGQENRLRYARHWDTRCSDLDKEIRELNIQDNISLLKERKIRFINKKIFTIAKKTCRFIK